MCGIVGYVGKRNAINVLMNGLKTLEYRGYDSAGIAYRTANRIEIIKLIKLALFQLPSNIYK